MADLIYCLKTFSFFGIPLLYYYTNHNSSIICCLISGVIYLSFGNSLLASSIGFISFERSPPERSSFGDFEILVILSAILLLIKSPVAFAVFSIPLFKVVFIASVVDFF